MTKFEWKADYSVGDDKIDAQHQELLGILNDLAAQLQAGGTLSDARGLFDRLAAYVTEHFAYEEGRMIDAGYPDELVANHRDEHIKLLHDLQNFEKVFEQGDLATLEQMMPFLYGEWLIRHICGTDKDYAPYIARHH